MGDIIKYTRYVKVPGKIFEPVNGIVKAGLYKDEQVVLQWFVHNKAEQKIDYYDKKITEMKQKYDMDFSTFENKIHLRASETDFEEWDDFVLWGSYVKAYRYWEQFC
ncbi:MAG: hypothetical protein NHB15_15605 [Methanosarcina barkeri]|nr:hypothetical protein [Methanosarcina sp. ERenArc_MAG2]